MLWLGLEWMVSCLIWGQLLISLDASEWCKECQEGLDSFIHSFIHPSIHLSSFQPEWAGSVGAVGTLLFCPLAGLSSSAGVLLTSFVVVNSLTVTCLIVVTDCWTREGLFWLTVWEDMCYRGGAAMATAWGSCIRSQEGGERGRETAAQPSFLFFSSA